MPSGPSAPAKVKNPRAARKAKIICTLGPSTDQPGVLERLVDSGMDAARLNLSFGETGEHIRRIQRLRELAKTRAMRPVAIIADIPGRKVRLGRFAEKRIALEPGKAVRFLVEDGQISTNSELRVPKTLFHDNLMRGDKVLLSDGLVELVVSKIEDGAMTAEVIYGGEVSERTGVHMPGLSLKGGPLNDSDIVHLKMAIEQDLDYIAVTYVGDGADVLSVRETLNDLGREIPVIAKIERSEAFARLDGILRRADAVMIRRGDLGAEIEITRIPLVQKDILRLATSRGVPVIIATQMLGSMISTPTPTRAEASDVSNAVADGADGVLLSAETATGKYPVEAVAMMGRIISETERSRVPPPARMASDSVVPFDDATASIACQAAVQCNARLIVCFTESGKTAKLVAKYRSEVPIIAFCTKDQTRRALAVTWGVRTDHLEPLRDVEEMVCRVEQRLLHTGLVRQGDRLVIAFGAPVGEKGHTNSVRLHEVGLTSR
jgi:pyruvate kinase